ncbi:MAG: HD domain-containing protein [Candidatus Eremiobacteraeota bacterium]|nr:HD domain-containing protein [Candidatus Eremiobacteraeota bacterium]
MDEKTKLDELINIGIALASEKRLDKLLEKIVEEARQFAGADAGSVYLKEGDLIRFVVSQNDTLRRRFGKDKEKEDFISFTMPISRENIAGYVAASGQILNLEDAYRIPEDKPFRFNKSFDKKTGYRSKSMLVVPMIDVDKDVVGVIQLINSMDADGNIVPFKPSYEKLTFSLASQAAVAVRMAQMREELKSASLDMIQKLSVAAEYRDEDTANHIKRMSSYSAIITKHMGYSNDFVDSILFTSPMHDIGKLGVPDSILLKPGKLNKEEWEEMQRHALYGKKILEGSSHDLIRTAESIAISHHEKWNGKGYPSGLAGEDIPIEGRIVALADVFDALSSKRCYKNAFPLEKTIAIIKNDTGTHFDPKVSEAFFKGLDEIMVVYNKYRESGFTFNMGDIKDWVKLVESLTNLDTAAKRRVWEMLEPTQQGLVESWKPDGEVSEKLKLAIIKGFNRIVKDNSFYREDVFREIEITDDHKKLLEEGFENLCGSKVQKFNRLLFEIIFPEEIKKARD